MAIESSADSVTIDGPSRDVMSLTAETIAHALGEMMRHQLRQLRAEDLLQVACPFGLDL